MKKIPHLLRSSRGLVAFEAAARTGSFTRAAEELGMQQPSISAAIKQLELSLGVQLFLREHRRVELSPAGRRLYSDIAGPLGEIETAFRSTREKALFTHVTISTSSAFSYYWMMPRLRDLREIHPEIDLRMQNSNRDPELDAENISLGIRLGDGGWRGYHQAKIAEELIYPVASPQVMAAATTLRSIPSLLNQRLIHLEEPVRQRPNWSQWFAHHGIPDRELTGGLRLNDYALVLQAALSGEGFAFGWDHVVRTLLDRGTLAARPDWGWRTGNGIYLIWSERQRLSEPAELVRDWIIAASDFPTG